MISGIVTLLAMLCFVGVVWWAYAPRRRQRFDEAAALPLSDERPAVTTRGLRR